MHNKFPEIAKFDFMQLGGNLEVQIEFLPQEQFFPVKYIEEKFSFSLKGKFVITRTYNIKEKYYL